MEILAKSFIRNIRLVNLVGVTSPFALPPNLTVQTFV